MGVGHLKKETTEQHLLTTQQTVVPNRVFLSAHSNGDKVISQWLKWLNGGWSAPHEDEYVCVPVFMLHTEH